MGGLIITGYLDRKGKSAPVSKVATLGTPYKGSFEAVIKIATGTANLGSDTPNSRAASRVHPRAGCKVPGRGQSTLIEKQKEVDAVSTYAESWETLLVPYSPMDGCAVE